MNTSHSWFGSGSYTLPRHIDMPAEEIAQLGAVVVPPFGWEDICSYRPLRFLGKTLAAHGIPTLRFDLPGTGDSSGGALDAGLVEAWIRSVGDAAEELRAATGVQNVAVIGIGMGANLAAAAASRANFQDLVLWGCAANGRALVRELRAFAQLETQEFANGDPPPPQLLPGLEVAGFLVSPETQKDLESLSIAGSQLHGRRILVLSRDELRIDPRLVSALQGGGVEPEIGIGSGYAAMMAAPHEAVPPTATAARIAEFLKGGAPLNAGGQNSVTKRVSTELRTTAFEEDGARVLETIWTLKNSPGHSPAPIFGVLSEPEARTTASDLCLLFLNPGSTRHIGANRNWVQAARRWAARGIPSLRMDVGGEGESDTERLTGVAPLYETGLIEDIEAAMAALRASHGARRFIAIGLCSGAFWAFHAAIRNAEVRRALLLNPRLFFWDPEVDQRRMLRRTVNGFTSSSVWRRMFSGQITPQRIKEGGKVILETVRRGRAVRNQPTQIPAEELARALSAVGNNRGHLTLVFTEGEPLLEEMEEERQMPPQDSPHVHCVRVANCGHTFRPLWSQQFVHELIDRELEAVLQENTPFCEENVQKAAR